MWISEKDGLPNPWRRCNKVSRMPASLHGGLRHRGHQYCELRRYLHIKRVIDISNVIFNPVVTGMRNTFVISFTKAGFLNQNFYTYKKHKHVKYAVFGTLYGKFYTGIATLFRWWP